MTSSRDRDHDSQNSGFTRLSRIAVSWVLTAAAVCFVVGIMTYGSNRPTQKLAAVPQPTGASVEVSNVSIQINISSETDNAPGSKR